MHDSPAGSLSHVPAIDIRAAHPGDLAAVQAIYAHHVLHGVASFEIVPPDVDEMRSRFEAITGAGYPYLVAVDGGTVRGYAYASAYRSRPAYRHTVEDSVYVAVDAVGRGIGRRLLTRLIDDCEALGYRQMLAIIGDSANAASIELHRTCGFAVAGTLASVGFKRGRWIDSVIMQRGLGESDRSPPSG
jgi:phosphinothricin acetyltransferase